MATVSAADECPAPNLTVEQCQQIQALGYAAGYRCDACGQENAPDTALRCD